MGHSCLNPHLIAAGTVVSGSHVKVYSFVRDLTNSILKPDSSSRVHRISRFTLSYTPCMSKNDIHNNRSLACAISIRCVTAYKSPSGLLPLQTLYWNSHNISSVPVHSSTLPFATCIASRYGTEVTIQGGRI